MNRFLIPLISVLLLLPSIVFSNPTSRDSFEWDGTVITKFIGEETDVVIPDGTTDILPLAFLLDKPIKSIVFPKSMTTIKAQVFCFNQTLTTVVFSEGVTEIEEGAFVGCESLTSVTIPNSLRKIGPGAFSSCTSLKQWSISPTHPYFKSVGPALLTKEGKKLIACHTAEGEYRIPSC